MQQRQQQLRSGAAGPRLQGSDSGDQRRGHGGLLCQLPVSLLSGRDCRSETLGRGFGSDLQMMRGGGEEEEEEAGVLPGFLLKTFASKG